MRKFGLLLILTSCAVAADIDKGESELTANNIDTGFVQVHPVETVEDQSISLQAGVTLGPRLLLGGDQPNVESTVTAFRPRGGGPVVLNIGDAELIRLTLVGSDPTDTNEFDDNFAVIRADVDLRTRTFTGSIQDLSGPNNRSQFAWSGQDLGADASAATDITGFTGNRRDIQIDESASLLTIDFPRDAPGLQYALVAELLDTDADSLVALENETVVLSTTAGTDAEFDVPPGSDVWVVSGYGFRNGTNAQHERKMLSRVVILEEGGEMVASGIIAMLAGRGVDETVTYSFSDYILGTDDSGPRIAASAVAGSDTSAAAISNHDLRLYLNGETLVIEETAVVSTNWTSMYNTQFLQRTGAGSPARVLPSSFAQGDLDSVGGADFFFDIPAGATAGTIRYSAVFSNDLNENSGLVEIFVDLENNTSSGLAFGNRVTVGDLTAWDGVPLDTPTPLVTGAGLAAGVASNRTNLGQYTDPQWGGITVTRESTGTGERIRVRTSASTNQFNPYEFDGGLASWLGRQGLRLVRAPEGGTFSGGGFSVDPTGGVVLSIGAITSGLVRWTPPDNFNGTVEMGILLDDEPGVVSTFDVIVAADTMENEVFTRVATGDLDPAGDTVTDLLGTSATSPGATGNGIAIVDAAGVGAGAFEFSLDGGASWNPLGTVSQSAALLVGPTGLVRFVPDGTTEGEATLTYDAWDGTAHAAGERVDTTADPASVAGADVTLFSLVADVARLRVESACGNGFLEPSEGCDDGDTDSGDGCDAACLVELGESCGEAPGLVGAASCASTLCDMSGGAPGLCEAVGVCGNGVLDAGEGCDDGGATSGDGCSAACLIENDVACNASAPGDVGGASCASGICDVSAGAPGVCEAAGACGNSVLETGEGCDDGGVVAGDGCDAGCRIESGLPCNATPPGLSGDGSCGSGICDASSGAPGTCEEPNVCGNGRVEGGEACDDGNASAGDGCSATCLVENGSPCTGGDASCESNVCDLSGGAPGICEAANACGNGRLDAGEGCDDGALASGDGCDALCRIENGGACNAAAPGATGAASCASAVCDVSGGAPGTCEAAGACGNGVVDAGEGCDDGDTSSGDGCSANCLVEDGEACGTSAGGVTGSASCASGICDTSEAAPGLCEPAQFCGNGVLESGEGCDDGGTSAGDGCSATCRIESGNACNDVTPALVASDSCQSGICDVSGGAPGTCEDADACGNGVLEAGEGCDDGSNVAGDGCSASCLIESGNTCSSFASGATGDDGCASGICDESEPAPGLCEAANSCGNGVLEAGEGCDDGGVLSGDGCSATCSLEVGQSCNTSAPGDVGNASCESGICDASEGAGGVCEAANACGNGTLEAGEGCDDGNTVGGDACDASCRLEDGESCNAVAPGTTGAASCQSGVCDVSEGGDGVCEPADACGNGVLESGEGCDDGNTAGGDACDATCRIESGSPCNAAAPGLMSSLSCQSGVCDASEGGDGICEDADICGNGALEDGEGCDDGNATSGDGCDASCLVEDGGGCNTDDAGIVAGASCVSGICDVSGNVPPGVCESADTCGNGAIEAGEGCDDGNLVGGDGCTAACLIENEAACGDLAPGELGASSCESGICNIAAGEPGECAPGDACGNGVLEMGEGCDDGNVSGADGCGSDCRIENGNACNEMEPGLVGGDSCAGGLCSPDELCVPALTCGNGVHEPGEGCDDGDLDDADGCSSNCLVESGGTCNARAETLVGNAGCVSGICDETSFPSTCEPAGACGNGLLEAGEGCDDGNIDDADGCSMGCRIENSGACGTDDPGLLGAASCLSGYCSDDGECRNSPACGDGRLDPGEGCDDGAAMSGDGCNEFCLLEDMEPCNVTYPGRRLESSCASSICNTVLGEPGFCATVGACGNTVLDPGEGCDDGNTDAGDGCDAACLVEVDFACNSAGPGALGADSCSSGICNDTAGAPGTCADAELCGNGVLEEGEGCDDGGLETGDGCDQLCLLENGALCNARGTGLAGGASCQSGVCDDVGGAPGLCEPSNTCGNGTLEMGEGCDDGGVAGGDGCSADCQTELGELCNDDDLGAIGNASCETGACDQTGGLPGVCVEGGVCGNGVLESGEGCDDGNTDAADGCNAACLVEVDAPCNVEEPGRLGDSSCETGVCNTGGGSPGVCRVAPGCGNGVLDVGEGCEDGNNTPGDGCNQACLVENGAACGGDPVGAVGDMSCASGSCDTSAGDPGLCIPLCGNGLLEEGEGCDDGGSADDDACSAMCLVENDSPCNVDEAGVTGDMSCVTGRCDVSAGPPGICAALPSCGDGVVDATEGCDDGNIDAGDGCNSACLIEDGEACGSVGLMGGESCSSGVCDSSGGEPGVCAMGGMIGDAGVDAGPDAGVTRSGGIAGGAPCSATLYSDAPMPVWLLLGLGFVVRRRRRR